MVCSIHQQEIEFCLGGLDFVYQNANLYTISFFYAQYNSAFPKDFVYCVQVRTSEDRHINNRELFS